MRVAQRGTATVAQRSRTRDGRRDGNVAQLLRSLAALSLLALTAFGAACSSGGSQAAPDGSVPISCTTPTVCDGQTVRACQAGSAAEVVETCASGLACSRGRCTTSACATAEENPNSLQGCSFYTFDLDNVASDDGLPTSLLVTNPGQMPASAALERRDGPGAAATWTAVQTMRVSPRQSARFTLPEGHHEGGGLSVGGAFRLTTTLPVFAAHVQSDDSTPAGSSSSGGTLLLPAHVLGPRYRALTFAQVSTPALAALEGARGGAGQVVIVGAVDGTNVTITPSLTATLSTGDPPLPPGADGKLHVSLDEGDLFTLYSDRDGADLTGTEIAGDQPFAVFSGNISTTYGIAAAGISSPDLAHEQLLPVSNWDSTYVAAQLQPQSGVCDPALSPPGSSIWTILADQDGTEVRFSVATGQTPEPTRMLGAGESFHVVRPGDFVVTAVGGPVQVMQGIDCEPSLSSAVPTSNSLEDYWFAVLPNFDTTISIVRAVGVPLFLDGSPLDARFVSAGAGFEVAHLPIAPCPGAAGVCTHHLEGKFGLSLRGMDVLASYALTAPTWPCVAAKGAKNCVK
jgi:hypothetical protein